MNLNKIQNISKDIDFSPIIVTNNSKAKTRKNRVKQTEKTNSKNEITQANIDENESHPIVNPLISERFGKLFTTELETSLNNNKTVSNEYSPKKTFKNDKLFYEAKYLCTEMYNSKSKNKYQPLIDRRVKLYEDIKKGMNPMMTELQQSVFSPKSKKNDKTYHKKLLTSSNFKRMNLKTKSVDKTSNSIKNFVKHYYDEFKPESINSNSRKFLYQNYAIKFQIYKHNQMYYLNKNKLPPLRIDNNNKTSQMKDFSGLIPERKDDTKESKKEVYCIYKIMNKNKKENFLI